MKRAVFLATLQLACLASLAAPGAAWAHVDAIEATVLGLSPWALGAMAALGLRRLASRRTLAGALVLALGVFAFEDAVHSVHHLPDHAAATKCAVAAATTHLHAASADPPSVERPARPAAEGMAEPATPDVPLRAFHSHRGRAPPVPVA